MRELYLECDIFSTPLQSLKRNVYALDPALNCPTSHKSWGTLCSEILKFTGGGSHRQEFSPAEQMAKATSFLEILHDMDRLALCVVICARKKEACR